MKIVHKTSNAKILINDEAEVVTPNIFEPQPSPEEIQAQTLLNIEYLVAMSELTNL